MNHTFTTFPVQAVYGAQPSLTSSLAAIPHLYLEQAIKKQQQL